MEGKQYLAMRTRNLIGFAAKVHKTQRRAGKVWEGVRRWWGLEDGANLCLVLLDGGYLEIDAALSEQRHSLRFHYA